MVDVALADPEIGDQPSGRLYKSIVDNKKAVVAGMYHAELHDPGFVQAFASFVRSHRPVKFIGFYNGRTGGRLDIGTHPGVRAAYRRSIVPLTR